MKKFNRDLNTISAGFVSLSEESQIATNGGINWLKFFIQITTTGPILPPSIWYLKK